MTLEHRLAVEWLPPRWWSYYNRGIVNRSLSGSFTEMYGFTVVPDVWRHSETGEIRIYTQDDINGVSVLINGKRVIMRARGRFGRLYVSEHP